MSQIERSIDIGYGQTKYTYDVVNNEPVFKSFPSIVEQLNDENERLIKSPAIQNATVKVKDKLFEVGHDVIGNSYNTGVLSEDFTKMPQHKALLLGALSLMKPVDVVDTLVLGLPVEYLKTKTKALEKLALGQHKLSGGRQVSVKNVEVIAQPLGGYLEWFHSAENIDLLNMKVLVIDPGFYTFDYMVAKNGRDIAKLSGSFPGGMSMLLEFVAAQISKKYNINYTNLRAIEEGIMSGIFRLYGKPCELKPLMKPFQQETVSIIQRILNQVGDGRDIDQIILVGGGSQMFFGAVKQLFNKHPLVCLDNPVMSNVRGFQRYPGFIRETYNVGVA